MGEAKLIAIDGPLTGQIFAVTGDRFRIGRDPSSSLRLGHASVSRHHCELRSVGDAWTLIDVDSSHGVFVNGVPTKNRVLRHGDQLRITTSLFLFLEHDEEEGASQVTWTEAPALTETAVFLPPPSLDRGIRAPVTSGLPPRSEASLEALFQLSEVVAGARTRNELAVRVADIVLRFLPADRAAVLLTGADGEIEIRHALGRDADADTPFSLSRGVSERILRDRVALLCEGPRQVDTLRSSAADVQGELGSLIGAPLLRNEHLLGLLYADTAPTGPSFDQSHLSLLTAMSRIVAAALDSTGAIEVALDESRKLRAETVGKELVGESAAIRGVCELIARVARTDTTVLIRGESGTGKDLVARALHDKSRRSAAPFMAINCAAISETLLESELFGHERGSFTGAIARKIGRLEQVGEGTLFLDEIGDMPLPLQAKLLRVLESRTFERVGGLTPIKVAARFVAATNRDLEHAIRDGRFREDLFFRLNVISIETPALRSIREDIPLLARHFASRFASRLGKRFIGFTPEALRALQRHAWRGNVRELANAIERAMVLGNSELVGIEDLPESVIEEGVGSSEDAWTFHGRVLQCKREILLESVRQAGGNLADAARSTGLNPTYLHRLIRTLELRDEVEALRRELQ